MRERFINYEITDEELGRGGTGVVYKAIRYFDGLDKQSPAACKVIRAELSDSAHHEEGLEREAFLALELAHPNLVKVYDCFREDDKIYLMMEYVDGMSLDELVLRYGPLPESVVAHVVHSMAQALAYLHSKGILHRDIAPPNILVSKDGHVKVTDLGLAQVSGDDPAANEFKGRMAFACPTLLRTKQHTKHSDLWALLVTAFDAASGYLPFGPDTDDGSGADFHTILQRIRRQDLARPQRPFTRLFKELTSDLRKLSAQERRFQSADDIADFVEEHFELERATQKTAQLVTKLAGEASDVPPPERKRPARRRRIRDTVPGSLYLRRRLFGVTKIIGLIIALTSLLSLVTHAASDIGTDSDPAFRRPPSTLAPGAPMGETASYLNVTVHNTVMFSVGESTTPVIGSKARATPSPRLLEAHREAHHETRPKQANSGMSKRRQKSATDADLPINAGASIPFPE